MLGSVGKLRMPGTGRPSGAITIYDIVGREIDSPELGVVAATLGLISPMARLIFGSMLSHAATSTALRILFLWPGGIKIHWIAGSCGRSPEFYSVVLLRACCANA